MNSEVLNKISILASLLSFDEDTFYKDYARTDSKNNHDMISSFFQSRKLVANDFKKDADLTQESTKSFEIINDSRTESLADGESIYSMDTFGRCSPTKKIRNPGTCNADHKSETFIKSNASLSRANPPRELKTLNFPRVGPSAFKYSAFRI